MIQFSKKITFASHMLNLCLKFRMQKFHEVVSYKMSYYLHN
jgi:hypothetical protein